MNVDNRSLLFFVLFVALRLNYDSACFSAQLSILMRISTIIKWDLFCQLTIIAFIHISLALLEVVKISNLQTSVTGMIQAHDPQIGLAELLRISGTLTHFNPYRPE